MEPDILVRAYEYLLRRFAEGQGQSAGDFFTPREVSIPIGRLVEPSLGMEVYDPAGPAACRSSATCDFCKAIKNLLGTLVGAGSEPAPTKNTQTENTFYGSRPYKKCP